MPKDYSNTPINQIPSEVPVNIPSVMDYQFPSYEMLASSILPPLGADPVALPPISERSRISAGLGQANMPWWMIMLLTARGRPPRGPKFRNAPDTYQDTTIRNLVLDRYGNHPQIRQDRHTTRPVTREDIRQLEKEFPDYTTRERTAGSGTAYVDFNPRQGELPLVRYDTLFGNLTPIPRLRGPQVRYITSSGFRHTPSTTYPDNPRYPQNMLMDATGAQNPFLNASVARDAQGRSLSERRVFMEEFRRRMGVQPERPPMRTRIPPNQLSFMRALLGE